MTDNESIYLALRKKRYETDYGAEVVSFEDVEDLLHQEHEWAEAYPLGEYAYGFGIIKRCQRCKATKFVAGKP